jgi:hypothetical protein
MAGKNDSYLFRQGASPQTNTVLSTRFSIYTHAVDQSKFTKLGVTSSFNVNESRAMETVRGLGYGDQVAEIVPGVTQPMSISITRTALYLANLMQMVGYKAGASGAVRSLKHHKWPFDIQTQIVFSELASEDAAGFDVAIASVPPEGGLNNLGDGNPDTLFAIVTVYEGCWMESYSTAYQVEQAAVSEDCSVVVTDVFDINGSVYGEFLDSGLDSVDSTGRSLLFTNS